MFGTSFSRNKQVVLSRLWFEKFPNAKTFPQIIINDEHIGTYNHLEQWLAFNNSDEDF